MGEQDVRQTKELEDALNRFGNIIERQEKNISQIKESLSRITSLRTHPTATNEIQQPTDTAMGSLRVRLGRLVDLTDDLEVIRETLNCLV